METTADKLRAFGFSIAVHLAVIAVVTVGLIWTHETKPVSLAGPIIEATLVGPAKTVRPSPVKPKPLPKPPEPKPQEEAKPEVAPEPPAQDKKNQDKVTDLAALKAAEDLKVQEEKRKKEQVLLEEQQKKDAAEKKKKLEDERAQQLKDKKLKELAAQQKKLEAEYQAQLEEAEQATSGNEGQDTSLEAEYFAAIQRKIEDNWLRPDTTLPGLQCMLDIVQLEGGDVMSVSVGRPCNADAATRETLEQAVKRAVPLPYDEKYRPYFRRQIKLNFKYDG